MGDVEVEVLEDCYGDYHANLDEYDLTAKGDDRIEAIESLRANIEKAIEELKEALKIANACSLLEDY